MTVSLTRGEIAEQLLSSVRVGRIRDAASSRALWREHGFRGFRPNTISRTTALSRAPWFAGDPVLLGQLIDVYLHDLSISGAFAERLSAAAGDARIPEQLRTTLRRLSEINDLADLPLGPDVGQRQKRQAAQPKPPSEDPETAQVTTPRDTASTTLGELESSESDSDDFGREPFEWAQPHDDAGVIQDAVTRFERSLSSFVRDRLRRLHGDAWLRTGCGPYRARWRERATGAAASPPESELGYAEISELGEIIRARTNWRVFKAYFNDKAWVDRQFASILPLRVEGFHPGARTVFAPEEAEAFAAMARVASCYHTQTADDIELLWLQQAPDEPDPTAEIVPTSDRVLKNFDTLPRPRMFGRAEQLRGLHEFWNDEFSRTVSITGRGGLGKTALVYEFVANLLRAPVDPGDKPRPELAILLTAKQTWAEEDDQERLPDRQRFGTLREALEATLNVFGVAAGEFEELPGLRTAVLELARDNDCLFVFDNLETLDDDEIRAVALFCQQLPRPSKAIVTDRDRRGVGIGATMILPGLSVDESLQLIDDRLERASASLPKRSRSSLARVVEQLGGVPLYLHYLANLLTEGHTPAEALRQIRGADTLGLLRFSFESSLQRLPANATALLYYMSLKRDPATRTELLRLTERSSGLSDDLSALQDAHFIEYATGRDAIAFRVADPTLAEYVRLEAPSRLEAATVSRLQQRAGMRSEFARQPNVERAIRQTLDEAQGLADRAWAEAIEYLEGKREEYGNAPPLLARLGYFYFRNRQPDVARPLLESALASEWADAVTYRTLGLINLWDKRLNDAEENAEAALDLSPEDDQSKLLLGQVMLTRVEQSRFTLDTARRLEVARRALSLIEGSLIEDDYSRWQRRHNERRARLLDRSEIVISDLQRGG